MKKLFTVFTLILCASLAQAEVVDKVVAVVGSDIITLSDVQKFKSEKSKTKDKLSVGTNITTNNADALQALIDQKLIEQEMDRLQVAATPEDVNSAVQEVLQRNKATLEELKRELASKNTSFENYKKQLATQIRRMKFMGQVIYPRIKIAEGEVSKKAANSTDEARFHARMLILEERAPDELEKYLSEVRAKTLVEIKK